MTAKWLEIVENYTGLSGNIQKEIVSALFVFVFIYLLRYLILIIVFHYKSDIRIRYRWRKTTLYIATFAFLLTFAAIWIKGFSYLATYLAVLSAGLAVALKEPIENIAGWAFIVWRRPFDVGDRIQIGDQRGDVIDQRLFMFSLMEIGNWVDAEQSTGRVIHIPNGLIFNQTLANYAKGFEYIWNEMPVLITFESDWKKAKKILTKIANNHSENLSESAERKLKRAARKYMIFLNKKLTPIVYTSVKESGVMLTIRHLCEPHQRRTATHEIWEEILTAFEKEKNINFAYPTTRFYDDSKDEKSEA